MIRTHSASFSRGRARRGSASWYSSGSSTGRPRSRNSVVRSRLSRSAASAALAAASAATISRTFSALSGSDVSLSQRFTAE